MSLFRIQSRKIAITTFPDYLGKYSQKIAMTTFPDYFGK
jgi:hypothetical protein